MSAISVDSGDSNKSGGVCVVGSGDGDNSGDESVERLGEELEHEYCDCGVTCDGESDNSVDVEGEGEDGLGDGSGDA